MAIQTILANKSNYGNKRNISDIKYLVIHYTANDGDKAINNAKYFKNNIIKASAHYFVSDDGVVQSVQDNYVAWAVGGSKYSNCSTTGGGKYYGKCTNSNSISIELCDCKKDGKSNFTDKTLDTTIELAKDIIKKYNISVENVIRHFDVTGKLCPKPFVEDEKQWNDFKSKLVNEQEKALTKINKDSLEVDIKRLQTALNKISVGLPKLTVDGGYGQNTKKYVIATWKKWDWNKDGSSDGWTCGEKTLKKLDLI